MQVENVHLLVIEDKPAFLDEILVSLREERFGYKEITVAKNAAEALQKLDQPFNFDIVISDMRMEQDDSGFGILDLVQQRNLSTVVIILTANDTVTDCRRAFRAGAWDYISKTAKGDIFEVLNDSIQDAIAYLDRWGSRPNQQWLDENNAELEANYWGQYIAIANQVVIESADTEQELFQRLEERKLRRFTTTIKKIGDLRSIEELLQLGESDKLEFKSSLQWDVENNVKNEALQNSVLKSIVAFLNTEGGTVIIGVEDNGNIFGIEQDILSFKEPRNRTLDGFERHLVEIIKNKIGVKFLSYLKFRFIKINDQDICGVYVRKADQAAFLKSDKGIEFYIRTGNSTRTLNIQEFYDHINAQN